MNQYLEMDRRLAELLGWQLIEEKTAWVEELEVGPFEKQYLEGVPPGATNSFDRRTVPDFSLSPLALFTLIPTIPGLEVSINFHSGDNFASVYVNMGRAVMDVEPNKISEYITSEIIRFLEWTG